jgi:hypothetical protein
MVVPDNVWSHRAMFNLQFEFSKTSNQTMYGPIGQCPTDTFNPTFVQRFSCILLIECPFDLILLPLASYICEDHFYPVC